MTINYIDHKCNKCNYPQADVQGKKTYSQVVKNKKGEPVIDSETNEPKIITTTVIQIKCLGCKINHFLDDDDERCQKYFMASQ